MNVLMRAALTAVLVVSASNAWTQQTLKLGALYPYSGGLALLGDESFRGLEIAIEERNAAGGVQGKQLQIVKGDAVDPNQAVGEARRLISVEKVPVIFGTYSSSLSLALPRSRNLPGSPTLSLGLSLTRSPSAASRTSIDPTPRRVILHTASSMS